ncbi:MAG: hypothetical protein U0103_21215 [Candidatus Obscuribacterales bacterium]
MKKTKLEESKDLLVVFLHPQAKDLTELPRPITHDKNKVEALELMSKQTLPLLIPLGFKRIVTLGYGINGINHPSFLVLSDERL